MANMIFSLDVITPTEAALDIMAEGGWVIALAALLVIGAAVGILIFNKNKNKNNNSKGE